MEPCVDGDEVDDGHERVMPMLTVSLPGAGERVTPIVDGVVAEGGQVGGCSLTGLTVGNLPLHESLSCQ